MVIDIVCLILSIHLALSAEFTHSRHCSGINVDKSVIVNTDVIMRFSNAINIEKK